MKILSIDLENVKCFQHQSFRLSSPETNTPLSVCVFVGANGSGKSSILKAIVAAFSGLDSRYAGDMMRNEDIFWNKDFLEIKIKILLNEDEKQALNWQSELVEIHYRHTKNQDLGEDSFNCPENINNKASYEKLLNKIINDMRIGLIMYYDPFRFLSIQNPIGPNLQLEKNPKSNALSSNLTLKGQNTFRDLELKQWMVNIDYQKLKMPTAKNLLVYEQIVKAFDLLMSPLKFKHIDANGSIVFEDTSADEDISLDMLSDGFKSLFFIAIDITRRLSQAETFDNEPFYMKEAIILIDEVDCHIHPKWQQKLLPSLRDLFPKCQFIVTTHSPYILDSVPDISVKKVGGKQVI